MNEKDIAAIMAGQTALLSAIVGVLIDKGIVSRQDITAALHDLMAKHAGDPSAAPGAIAPTKHLMDTLTRKR